MIKRIKNLNISKKLKIFFRKKGSDKPIFISVIVLICFGKPSPERAAPGRVAPGPRHRCRAQERL